MKNTFSKYLTLTVVLLLAGLTNTYANTTIENGDYYYSSNDNSEVSAHLNTNNSSLFSFQKNEDTQLLFDYTEAEEVENEESVSTTIKTFSSYISTFSEAQLLSDLSSKLQKEVNSFTYTFCQPSTKLHVRLSVFII